jgi:hypothetical protein
MHAASALIVTAWFARGTWTDNVVDEAESPAATPAD